MEIVTTDGIRLWIAKLGEPNKESSKVTCLDTNGNKVAITYADIAYSVGSYSMPPKQSGKVNNLK